MRGIFISRFRNFARDAPLPLQCGDERRQVIFMNQGRLLAMKFRIALASAAFLAASAFTASAQAPAPGNVDPASPRAGSEHTGTGQTMQPNQPTPRAGTTGQGSRTAPHMAPGDRRDPGINANTNPGSKESGPDSSGAEPAPQRR
jgi:hypothetical protein